MQWDAATDPGLQCDYIGALIKPATVDYMGHLKALAAHSPTAEKVGSPW